MWQLKAYRSARPGVADLLPWALLADSGLVATKKGALIGGTTSARRMPRAARTSKPSTSAPGLTRPWYASALAGPLGPT